MPKINLLPTDVRPSAPILKVIGVVKKITFAGLVVFILFLVGLGAFFIFDYYQTTKISEKEGNLKKQIIANQEVEQKSFLVRDRVKRISAIMSTDFSEKIADHFSWLGTNIPVGVDITGITFEGKDIEETLTVDRSAKLLELFSLVNSIGGNFAEVELTSLKYNPQLNYRVNLRFLFK